MESRSAQALPLADVSALPGETEGGNAPGPARGVLVVVGKVRWDRPLAAILLQVGHSCRRRGSCYGGLVPNQLSRILPMNTPRIPVLALAALLAVPGFLVSGQALAQDPCAENGSLMTGAREAQAQRAKEAEDHARAVYGPMAKSPDWLSDANSLLANCVADQYGDWKISTGSAIFDQIANKAKDAAIDKICAEQRKRVAEYTSQASGFLSRIEGFQNIGSQVINFPEGMGGITYDELIGDIGGGLIPQIPGTGGTPGTGGIIPGVGGGTQPPVQQPSGGIPGITP